MEVENLDMKKDFIKSLNERQKRHFLAVEANQLGYGGISLVSRSFGVNRKTISAGIRELTFKTEIEPGRIRRKGGGRKKKIETKPELTKIFAEVIVDYTAGKPQDDTVRWIGLKPTEIQDKLAEMTVCQRWRNDILNHHDQLIADACKNLIKSAITCWNYL